MRILVTGGAGFIGSHLCERLTLPISIDRKPSDVSIDVTRIGEIRFSYAPTFCYHLAATVGVSNVLKDPTGCMENNIDSLRAVLALGIPGMFFSTSEVYGKTTGSLSEDSPLSYSSKSRWSYAASKMVGEWMALQKGWKVIRPFNVVGPRQNMAYGAVLPNFVKQALSGEPITVYGDGSQVRTFIDVRDFVEIVTRLQDKEFDVVNVGGAYVFTISELAIRVRHVLGSQSRIILTPYPQGGGFEECRERVPDLTKMHGLVGDFKFRPFDETIKTLAESIKEGEHVSVCR